MIFFWHIAVNLVVESGRSMVASGSTIGIYIYRSKEENFIYGSTLLDQVWTVTIEKSPVVRNV